MTATDVDCLQKRSWKRMEHRLTEKQVPYAESIRVPLVIRMPGMTTPRHVSQIVLNNDLAPTLAALGEATPTLMFDGRSLLPILQGQNPARYDSYLTTDPTDGQELYDLAADPYQLTNLAKDPGALEVQQFQNVLGAFDGCRGSSCTSLEQGFTVAARAQPSKRKGSPTAP